MNKILWGVCLLFLAALATSCGSKVENNPEKIAATVIKHLQAEEFENMKDYCSDEGSMYVDGFASTFKGTPLEKGLQQVGKTIFKLVKAKYVEPGAVDMYENKANVKYRFKYDDNDSWRALVMKFEKVDGKWKIVEFK